MTEDLSARLDREHSLSQDRPARTSLLIELGYPVARLYLELGRPHLEWVQLFSPSGEHFTLQRSHARRLALALLDAFPED